ncbi:MAG: RNA methyltransferase [Acidobacteria bacterium]|nr:RNA methyltransferase [Acidobacteriota bacterium]MCI0626072.1 RNA methyltransferase [Acidobacteriota bacterium]MCI0717402.1 RNA methyltransferase [Acidobacteriota bacterium]
MLITSASNSRLRQLRAALRDGQADSQGRVPIEGPKLVREAIQSHLRIEEVFVSESCRLDPAVHSLLEQIPGRLEIVEVSDRLFPLIVSTETPLGLLALVRLPSFEFRELLNRASLLLVGCELQDPGNLGTLLRSAEAFAVSGVLLTENSVSPRNAKVIRASAGSIFRVPCLGGLESAELLHDLARNGFTLVAATPKATVDFRQPVYQGRVALLVGNEGKGLSKEILSHARVQIRIPMEAAIESLNVSVATSIILCEAARQRNKANRR